VRDGDHVGRLGGDEFLVICPDVDSEATAYEIGRRLTEALTTTITIDTHAVALRASVGVSWTDHPLDADTFVARSDDAMYQAKQATRTTGSDGSVTAPARDAGPVDRDVDPSLQPTTR
jgi:diguanylate cyclase (GGDEF)-like protein